MKKTLLRLVLPLMLAVMMLPVLPLSAMAEEPLTVTVFVGEPRDQPTSDNKVFQKIAEEFGLKFEFEFLAGDLNETLGVKIAGQDYADLMVGGNYAEKLITAGAFVDHAGPLAGLVVSAMSAGLVALLSLRLPFAPKATAATAAAPVRAHGER